MTSNNHLNLESILIVGTVRDCAHVVEKSVAKLESAFLGVKSVFWLIVESDSDDDTVDILKKIQNNNENFEYISLGRLADKIKSRPDRIGYCRQVYAEAIVKNKKYDNLDYVVVSDLDDVNCDLTPAAIKSCWSSSIEWDAVFANQPGGYYDLWALRHPNWMPSDPFSAYDWLVQHGVRHYLAYGATISSKTLKIEKDTDWIPVKSAFGGLGIYKKKMFSESSYIDNSHRDASWRRRCEHVIFNTKLTKQGFQLYINPNLVNTYKSTHVRNIKLKYWLLRLLGVRLFSIIKERFF